MSSSVICFFLIPQHVRVRGVDQRDEMQTQSKIAYFCRNICTLQTNLEPSQRSKPRLANFLTRGPNSRLPGHWRVGYSATYVIYAKIRC